MINAKSLHSSSPVPVQMKQLTLLILFVAIVAGIANVFDRHEQLHALVATYYHVYLVQNGFSDDFYIWYFLVSETLLALAFAITGGIIALHRSATWVTLFAAIALMLFGVTVPPPMHALVTLQGSINPLLCLVRAIGFALFIIFLYIFPDGRLISRWTSTLTAVLIIWSLIWPFYGPLNPYRWSHIFPFLLLNFWFLTGVFAQIHRYVYISSPTQRQQTKWVVFGLTAAVLGDFLTHIAWYIFPSLQKGSDWGLQLFHQPFFIISQLLAPLSIALSVFRYGLWEIDFIINRTLIYGLLTTLLATVWAATAKLLEIAFAQTFGQSAAPLAAVFAVFTVSLIFGAVRTKLEALVNHYFYPDKLDLGRDFVEFLPEARASVSFSELLQILISRTLEILHIVHGAVFLRDSEQEIENQLQLVEAHNLKLELLYPFEWNEKVLNQVQKGMVVKQPTNSVFPLLVPLMLRKGEQSEWIGLLALGPRQDGRQYSLDELWTFKALASRAGTAIYIAQLNAANTAKLKQQITMLEQRVETIEAQLLPQ